MRENEAAISFIIIILKTTVFCESTSARSFHPMNGHFLRLKAADFSIDVKTSVFNSMQLLPDSTFLGARLLLLSRHFESRLLRPTLCRALIRL